MAGFALRGLRTAGGIVGAVAVLAAAAGCSSTTATTTAPASSPSSSSSSSPTASAPAASTSASATASPGVSSQSGPSQSGGGTAEGGPAGCTTSDLRVAAVFQGVAAGSLYQSIDFTNESAAKCTLYGYPGVSLAAGSPETQVGAAADRSATAAPTVVTLAPGQTASALLRVSQALNYPQATCSPAATTFLRVYPPGQTQAILLPFKATGCTSNSVKLLTVGVMQAGAGQR